ncbi:MAG: Ycf66 family protein [Cyanobium sp.]
MLATLAGCLALALGVAVLLLPVLVSELSRPRDAAWGAVVLLLGLVLVTGADRLTGAPMLAVLCGGLLIGRLGVEVGQGRWRQLTPEEQQRLGSLERWRQGLGQLGAALGALAALAAGRLASLGDGLKGLGGLGLGGGRQRRSGKRWVRPEAPAPAPAPAPEPATDMVEVADFSAIDQLLAAAPPAAEDGPEGPPEPEDG